MASSVMAYFVARSLNAGSMYAITEHRRELQGVRERLRGLNMRALVRPAETVIAPEADVAEMSRLFLQFPVKYLYVIDAESRYLGVVPLKLLGTAASSEALSGKRAVDLLSQEIVPIVADTTLAQALQRFMDHRGERLPVIESEARPVLLGVVNKSTLLETYVRLSE